MSSVITDELMEMLSARGAREAEVARALLTENPNLGITAYVIAGDVISAERATEMVKDGVPAAKALNLIGSYARFQWAVDNLPRKVLLKMLPRLWSGADPDDTKPEYLELWYEAWNSNCQGAVYDDGRNELPWGELTIFRGQSMASPVGISWTLDRGVARKFAFTGGGRGRISDGVILTGRVMAGAVLAYITGRNESEVIADPENVTVVRRQRVSAL
jgi:hypothetical protein